MSIDISEKATTHLPINVAVSYSPILFSKASGSVFVPILLLFERAPFQNSSAVECFSSRSRHIYIFDICSGTFSVSMLDSAWATVAAANAFTCCSHSCSLNNVLEKHRQVFTYIVRFYCLSFVATFWNKKAHNELQNIVERSAIRGAE